MIDEALYLTTEEVVRFSVHGDKKLPVSKKLTWLIRMIFCIFDALSGRCRWLAIGILDPGERRGDIVHLFVDMLEGEVAIGSIPPCAKEIDTGGSAINTDILKDDVIEVIRGSRADEESVRAGVENIDIIERDIIDGIIIGAADIDCSLRVAPEIAAVSFCTSDAAAVVDGDIIDIDCSVLVKAGA